LIRAVAKAYSWNKQLVTGEVVSGRSIARSENVTPRYIYKLLPLAHLAPDIVTAICEGRQPQDLTLDTLVYSDMPSRWEDQRRKFGFPAI
jgi:site-specific DNA recombinase